MRKITSFLWSVVIIIIAAGTVFYFGYSTIKVQDDKIGVLVSKTSGVNQNAIVRGKFLWNWEFLIPTNAKVRTFSAKPISFSKIKTGELPSGQTYAKQLSESTSFNYTITFNLELKVNPEQCVELVKQSDIATDSDLQKKLLDSSDEIFNRAIELVLAQIQTEKNVNYDKVKETLVLEYNQKNITISDFQISNANLPDPELYQTAKTMYLNYMQTVEQLLLKQAENHASKIADYNNNLNKLEKFGKVLKDHPELADFLKSSKDMNETLKTIYAFN